MKLKISPLLIIMAFTVTALGYGYEFFCYAVTIILHEMAHAEASRRLGYTLNVIKLMPHGASLTGAFEGVRQSDEVLIALAGPAINVIIAVVCVALWWLVPASYFFTEVIVTSNVCTAVFNLFPIFPLDGGRALLALLSRKFKREKVYKVMRIVGAVFALVFASLFVATLFIGANFSFAAIAVFIFVSAAFPDKNSKYQRLYSMAYRTEKLRKGLAVREIMVSADTTVLQAMRMLNSAYFYRFNVMGENFTSLGIIDELKLEAAAVKFGNNSPLKKVLGNGD